MEHTEGAYYLLKRGDRIYRGRVDPSPFPRYYPTRKAAEDAIFSNIDEYRVVSDLHLVNLDRRLGRELLKRDLGDPKVKNYDALFCDQSLYPGYFLDGVITLCSDDQVSLNGRTPTKTTIPRLPENEVPASPYKRSSTSIPRSSEDEVPASPYKRSSIKSALPKSSFPGALPSSAPAGFPRSPKKTAPLSMRKSPPAEQTKGSPRRTFPSPMGTAPRMEFETVPSPFRPKGRFVRAPLEEGEITEEEFDGDLRRHFDFEETEDEDEYQPHEHVSLDRIRDIGSLEDHFTILSNLGRGTYGTVYEVEDENRDIYALKRYNRGIDPISALKEYNLLQEQGCIDGLVCYHDIFYATEELDEGGSTRSLYVLMEYYPGENLHTIIEERPEELDATTISERLLEILDNLHSLGLVHLDIKPDNIVVDEYGEPTLVDLGLSCRPGSVEEWEVCGTVAGTEGFMAPEIYYSINCGTIPNEAYFAADIWSMGLVLWSILSGRIQTIPFEERIDCRTTELDDFAAQLRKQRGPVRISGINRRSLRSIIESIFVYDYKDRPEANQLIADFLQL